MGINVRKHGKINLFSFVRKKAKNIKFHEWMSCVGEEDDKLIATDGYIAVCNVDMRELSGKEQWHGIPQSDKNNILAGDTFKHSYGNLKFSKVLAKIDADYFVQAIDYAISLKDEFEESDKVVLFISEECQFTPIGYQYMSYATIGQQYFPKFKEFAKNGISSVEFLSNGILYLRDKLGGSSAYMSYSINKYYFGNMKLENGINEVDDFYVIKL